MSIMYGEIIFHQTRAQRLIIIEIGSFSIYFHNINLQKNHFYSRASLMFFKAC